MFKICIMLAAFAAHSVLAQTGMGPLNLNLISSKTCDGDQGYAKIDVVNLSEEQQGLNVAINFDFPFDESISYSTRVDKIQNGEIQEGIFSFQGAYACEDFAEYLGDVWNKIVTESGMPEGCPKDPGEYQVENFPFDDKDVNIESFFYGRFLMNIDVQRSGTTIACMVIEFTNSKPGESY